MNVKVFLGEQRRTRPVGYKILSGSIWVFDTESPRQSKFSFHATAISATLIRMRSSLDLIGTTSFLNTLAFLHFHKHQQAMAIVSGHADPPPKLPLHFKLLSNQARVPNVKKISIKLWCYEKFPYLL